MHIFVSKSTHWLKSHYWAFVLALAVGIISVAPQVFFSFSPGYQGIQMFGTDTEEYYVARIHEVYEGHFRLGNVFLPDKVRPYMAPPLGEILTAGIGKILFLDAVRVDVFSKFLFPFLLFLLLYFFIYEVFVSKHIAILASSLVLLGDNLLSSVNDIIGLATFTTTSTGFLTYTRPVNPEISSLLLFASLYMVWKVAETQERKNKGKAFVLGTLFGLSIYVSIYVWSFLLVAIFLALLYSWLKKNGRISALFIALATHAVIAVPFWLNSLEARMYPEYLDAAARLGLGGSRAPIWGVWLVFVTVAVFFLWPRRYPHAKWFFGFLVASSWVVTNQQIITGVVLQPGHYHWYIIKPLASIVLAILFISLGGRLVKKKYAVTVLAAAGVLILFYNAVLIQFYSYRAHLSEAVEKQRYATLVSYVEQEYKVPQTIWSDANISAILSMYTRHNAPNHNSVFAFLSSKEYLVKRLFLEYRTRGIRPEAFADALAKEEEMVSGRIFGHLYHDPAVLPREVSGALNTQYETYYHVPYAALFQYFSVDIVVRDRRFEPDAAYESTSALKKTVEVGDGFVVYKLK
ncbi:MAG: hypothetical protein HY506_02285, partial [Candidatus Yanofskybacteria bacterium]|nr:hypothetical protein [Candidatus Yanofskybacteria bacterium]